MSGKISIQGSGKVDIACFRYGTTAQTEHMVPTDDTEGETSVLLNELSPNTLYYFRLEASNGYQTVVSACDSFRTAPNTSPVLSKITELGHTPMSVLLSCKIENDGGSPIKMQDSLSEQSMKITQQKPLQRLIAKDTSVPVYLLCRL